jgi:hypothetical protein
VWPATAWDDDDWGSATARGWTVMSALRARRDALSAKSRDASGRSGWDMAPEEDSGSRIHMVQAVPDYEVVASGLPERWSGGPMVLAFVFAQPDSEAIQTLDKRGDYFDRRTDDTWDLFFPGYYRSPGNAAFEIRVGGRRVGKDHLDDWFFNARDFDDFRRTVQQYSGGRWRYSGGTDLVLVTGWMATAGDPTIAWETTVSGSLTDVTAGTMTLTLSQVIERISNDIELALDAPSYGAGAVTNPRGEGAAVARDLLTNALGGIVAALVTAATGI